LIRAPRDASTIINHAMRGDTGSLSDWFGVFCFHDYMIAITQIAIRLASIKSQAFQNRSANKMIRAINFLDCLDPIADCLYAFEVWIKRPTVFG
jgi:hypothetical protein